MRSVWLLFMYSLKIYCLSCCTNIHVYWYVMTRQNIEINGSKKIYLEKEWGKFCPFVWNFNVNVDIKCIDVQHIVYVILYMYSIFTFLLFILSWNGSQCLTWTYSSADHVICEDAAFPMNFWKWKMKPSFTFVFKFDF